MSRFDVVAICDQDMDKARGLARRFKVPRVYERLSEMLGLEDLDLVDVCVPPDQHAEVLMETLTRSLPCMVEKPLTVTTSDADRVIACARLHGVDIYALHTYSALPGVLQAKELVRREAIGRVLGIDVVYLAPLDPRHLDARHWCHRLPGDYFSEVGPHLAILVAEFLGDISGARAVGKKVSAYPHQIRFDELRILVEAEHGLATLTCSLNNPARRFTLDIFGTGGAIHVDGNSQAVVLYDAVDSALNAWRRGWIALRDVLVRIKALTRTSLGVLTGRYLMERQGHRQLMTACLESLICGVAYPIDLGAAREAVKLLEMAFEDIGAASTRENHIHC
jgi:predicted dehydrogenase